MIYFFIGSSCAGKSQIVFNTFVKGQNPKVYKDVVSVTETDSAYLIGDFLLPERVKGTDRLSRAHIPLFFEQIKKLTDRNEKDVVIEGYKINAPLLDQCVEAYSGGACPARLYS